MRSKRGEERPTTISHTGEGPGWDEVSSGGTEKIAADGHTKTLQRCCLPECKKYGREVGAISTKKRQSLKS